MVNAVLYADRARSTIAWCMWQTSSGRSK